LELAEDPELPLLERVRFLSIFCSNLDEFYMVRVATLKRLISAGITTRNSSGYTPAHLLGEISTRTRTLAERSSLLFQESLRPALDDLGIHIVSWETLTVIEREYVSSVFERLIFPVLTPLAVDPSRPFPYISGLSLNLAAIVRRPQSELESFARIKVPTNLPRFVETSRESSARYIPLEQVISAHLEELFPGMEIVDYFTFRLTRNADLELEEDETEDLITSMEQELQRRKFGHPVRLEVDKDIKEDLLATLVEELDLAPEEVIRVSEPLDLASLVSFADFDIPEHRFEKFRSTSNLSLAEVDEEDFESMLAVIRNGEVLLHHPYESFSDSVVRFIEMAARDPQVLAIKQTLYRTSGDSPIMAALIEAAQAGKQVLAVVELRARFDELANVRWARKLEDAGVHVVYGLLGLKTHAKLSLIVREESAGIRRYCHVGTGNYNPKTARIYDDLGILSCDPVLGEDLTILFNQLSGFAPEAKYSRLLVAPKSIRRDLIAKIDREIENAKSGKKARIRMKLNSLVDEEFCDYLYWASQAGVDVDLWVRGTCSIQPGVTGLSDRIRVRSILGRFLEHSRIFNFYNDGHEEFFIGSADLMERNLDRRVEALVRVDREEHCLELQRQLDDAFSDHIARWELHGGKNWHRIYDDAEGHRLADFQENEITRRKGRR
jgi:polyphosphate kinase